MLYTHVKRIKRDEFWVNILELSNRPHNWWACDMEKSYQVREVQVSAEESHGEFILRYLVVSFTDLYRSMYHFCIWREILSHQRDFIF